MSSFLAKVYFILIFSTSAQSFQLFTKSSLPNSYSEKCISALTVDITRCKHAVASFDANAAYSQKVLDTACRPQCETALTSWQDDVVKACPVETYQDDYGFPRPVSAVPAMVLYSYSQTCLVEGGEYCNIILGNATSSTRREDGRQAQCSMCDLVKLRNAAHSPYFDGPLIRSEGVYESYTSSCGFKGNPLTVMPTSTQVSELRSLVTSTAALPAVTCDGETHKIRKEDTCHSISVSQGIATNWLLLDNQLPAYCSDFPHEGRLCLKNRCAVYTVKEGDTCKHVAKAHNISTVQLRTWNPWIDVGCYNFNRTVGTQICVDEPGTKFRVPSTAVGKPSSAKTTAAVPTDVAERTVKMCGRYHHVRKGDTCNKLVLKHNISLRDFCILNPAVDKECYNLLAGQSYCVKAFGSINDYPSAPGYIKPTTSISKVAWSSLPDATYRPFVQKHLPRAPGTAKDCNLYVNGDRLKYPGAEEGDCAAAAYVYGTTSSTLQEMNPSLEAVEKPSCKFDERYRYCLLLGRPNASISNAMTPRPTSTGTSLQTATITQNKSSSSTSLPSSFITRPSTTATATQHSRTQAATLPSRTQANSIVKGCSELAKAKAGNDCASFAAANGIAPERLYTWNHVLGPKGENCNKQFWAGYFYCVSGPS